MNDPYGMLVPVLMFLATAAVAFALSFAVRSWQVGHDLLFRDAPGVSRECKKRNRKILRWTAAFAVLLLVIELFSDQVHTFLVSLQEAIADWTQVARVPFGVLDVMAGGASLGFFCSVVLGITCGLWLGSAIACKRFVRCRLLTIVDMI